MSSRSALIAAIFAAVVSIALALGFLAANDWFGVGDLSAMVIWTLPLAGLTYVSSRFLARRVSDWSTFRRYLVMVVVGGLCGVLWTIITGLILGGWIAAFSFPVAICWIAGGLAAGIAAAWAPERKSWQTATAFASFVVLLLIAVTIYTLTPKRQVRVALIPGASHADEERFWTEVVGTRTGRTPSEHVLLEGITQVGISGYEGGQRIFTVSFRPHLSREAGDRIIARIRRSPLLVHVDTVP